MYLVFVLIIRNRIFQDLKTYILKFLIQLF